MDRTRNLLSFSGRTTRLLYWQIQLVVGFIFIVILFGAIGIAGIGGEGSRIAGIAITVLAVLPVTIILLANGVRRLHDRNKSWWWILVYWIGPSILAELARPIENDDNLVLLVLAISLASLALSIWGLIEIGFRRGTRGPNRFGDDPLQPTAEVFT